MRSSTKILAAAALLVAGLAAAPSLYAHEADRSGGSMMGASMMGEMSAMMAGCNEMMQSMRLGGSGSPNDQWHDGSPHTTESPQG